MEGGLMSQNKWWRALLGVLVTVVLAFGMTTSPSFASVDTDGDGYSDEAELATMSDPEDPASTPVDFDGDGHENDVDAFPMNGSEWADSDGDGHGDNADECPDQSASTDNGCPEVVDTDGDTVPDSSDAFPNDPNESQDSDGDGTGDNADAFDNDPNESQDSDGDGVGNNSDAFPNDPTRSEADDDTPPVVVPVQQAGIKVVAKENPVRGRWATVVVRTDCDGSIQKRVSERVRWNGRVVRDYSGWHDTRFNEFTDAGRHRIGIFVGLRNKRAVADTRVVCATDAPMSARSGWFVLRR